jgi:GTP cyclohydrolase I
VVDHPALEGIANALILALGEDPTREGLRDTPRRFADAWREFIDYDPGRIDTAFTLEGVDEMVVVRGIEVWSLCEHHLLPFRAVVTIGYIAEDKVLGLSKLARIAHAAAHQLQVQERMTQEIAETVAKLADTPHVGVICYGEHLCMRMRGIRSNGEMRTSVLRGSFRELPAARQEFLNLADNAR